MAEIRDPFPVGIFGKQDLVTVSLPSAEPRLHDCLYLTFRDAEQAESRLGGGWRGSSHSPVPGLLAGFDHWAWPPSERSLICADGTASFDYRQIAESGGAFR